MAGSTSAARGPARPQLVIIAAVSENGVIGRGDTLPWRLPSDLRHFRALTLGKPVVMGRKTYQSIGRPLPGRTTVVISRDAGFAAPGVLVAANLAAALAAAWGDALRRGVAEIAIVGGADIYAQTLAIADRLEITRVHADVAGNRVFPAIDPACWRETARREQPAAADDDAAMSFITYWPASRPKSRPNSTQ